MNLQPHIKTLESVLAGRHPVTGADVIGNPLDDGETLRLLMRTLQALQALQIQLGGKGSMARRRAIWSDAEDARLKTDFEENGTDGFIALAMALERTPRSVAERAVFLELISSRSQCIPRDVRLKGLFAPTSHLGATS